MEVSESSRGVVLEIFLNPWEFSGHSTEVSHVSVDSFTQSGCFPESSPMGCLWLKAPALSAQAARRFRPIRCHTSIGTKGI